MKTNNASFSSIPLLKRDEGSPPHLTPSKPDPCKIANAVAPIFRTVQPKQINDLTAIAKLAGKRPVRWAKPEFGSFEYWLARNCGWIDDQEIEADSKAYQGRQQRALETSHRFRMQRFSWEEGSHSQDLVNGSEYCPQINMKLVIDGGLTDSSRRIAMFVMRHAYQDNRTGRYIGMTVSFIMKGLQLSRRTVQRSLTLLETQGYLQCEVAKGNKSRMCVGLIIHLMESLFPGHHKEKWPSKRRNSDAPTTPLKQTHFYKTIYSAPQRVARLSWSLRCMNGVYQRLIQTLEPLPAMLSREEGSECGGKSFPPISHKTELSRPATI